jgi:alpha-L-fucosidase
MPDGRIEERQAARLREMGDWLKKYGESIYATRAGPFRADTWGVSTHAGNRVFLHILKWPADGRILLPAMTRKIIGTRVLTGGDASVRMEKDRLFVSVPEGRRDPVDTIVALELDGPASEAGAGEYLSRSLTYKMKTSVSDSTGPKYAGDAAVDDDAGTNWRTNKDTRSAWLEVDLGADVTFDEALVDEYKSGGLRVDQFEIQVKQGDTWKTVYAGKNIGPRRSVAFPAVKARHARLNLVKTSANTFINEFQLFRPGEGWIRKEEREAATRNASHPHE